MGKQEEGPTSERLNSPLAASAATSAEQWAGAELDADPDSCTGNTKADAATNPSVVHFFPAWMPSSSRAGGRARLIQGGAMGSCRSVPVGSALPGSSNVAFSVSHSQFLALFIPSKIPRSY